MASPFRAFRRYQKVMIAVAGVVLMFVFVIGDPLMQYVGGGRSGGDGGTQPNEVAVTWDGGELTNAELSHLVTQRAIVNNFLGRVEATGRYAAMESGAEPQPLRVTPVGGPERLQDGVEQDVVRIRIFAEAARAAGMSVSDEYIVDYLRQLGRDYVTVGIVREILANMQMAGRPVSDSFILDALREELLARNYINSYTFALFTVMPEQNWQDWLRVNDRVVIEAAAVPAESFLVDVPDPTDAELVAFYDQYKNREPQPEQVGGTEFPSATPGFARPRKVELQYLRADFNKVLEKVESEVTDAEIEKFYEDNKDPYFVAADFSEEPETPATDTGGADSSGAADAPENESPPAEGAESKPADDDQSSREVGGNSNVFRLAAFQEEEQGGEQPAAAEAPSESATPDSSTGVQVGDEFPTDPAQAAEPPKKFQPLEDVRDEIRRQIAEVKVSDQLEKLVNDLEHQLSQKYTDYIGAVFDAEGSGKPAPAPPADLANLSQMATEHGLDYEKVGPVSFIELRDLPMGLSAQPALGNTPLVVSIFGQELELYQPVVSFDIDGNRYITMKTSDTAGSVPELAEVRDEVVKAYKLQKAADLALADAKELAKNAQQSGSSLEQFFANNSTVTVVKTDPFAFLTAGNVSRDTQQAQSFRLSKPDDIVAAGPDFMQTVFGLGDGEVGAVWNHDHSIAYVVKIAEHQETEADLRQAFLAEADRWYGIQAMTQEHSRIAAAVLVSDMLKAADVDWKRSADTPTPMADDDEAQDDADADADDEADAES